jgi:hypothetical protein
LEAGGTNPKGIGFQHFFLQAEKAKSDNLVGAQIHGKGNGTPGSTIPALIAGKKVLPADLLHLLRKLVMDLLTRNFNLHIAPLISTASGLNGLFPPIEILLSRGASLEGL